MINKDIYYVKKRIAFLNKYKGSEYSNDSHLLEKTILLLELAEYNKKKRLLKQQTNLLNKNKKPIP